MTGTVFADEIRGAGIRAIHRLLPYQNLFYPRKLFDAAEAGIKDALGAG